jgi:TPR repeat protein
MSLDAHRLTEKHQFMAVLFGRDTVTARKAFYQLAKERRLRWSSNQEAAFDALCSEKDRSNAFFTLGLRHEQQEEETFSLEKALFFFRLAAEGGHADAFFRLGRFHERGLGVTRSHEEAARHFQLAADKGHVDAMLQLAGLYKSGKGVRQNDKTALHWFKEAAKRGSARAHRVLRQHEKKSFTL